MSIRWFFNLRKIDLIEGCIMSSYDDLMQQAKALMEHAESLRKAELADVIADIKAKMKEYGITVSDLGGVPSKKKASANAKYRGPNGEVWAGGAGRKPDWIREVMAAGGDIERYRI
jgi:DNA-binding protein H-NS